MSLKNFFDLITTETWVSLGIITAFFVAFLIIILKLKVDNKLTSNRRTVEFMPTVISSLGVLGTFFGITSGLMSFDAGNLDSSIPELLNGLKTAFFTSLAGMLFSMILNGLLNRKQDKRDGGISDINQAASQISKSVQEMSEANTSVIKSIQEQLTQQESERHDFYETVKQVMTTIAESQHGIGSAIQALVNSQTSATSIIEELNQTTSRQTQHLNTITNFSSEIRENTNHIGEVNDVVSNLISIQEEVNTNVGRMREIIHGEVLEIEDNMNNTNRMLEEKFNEFSELLKKSNTEALVEVMKTVTEEFQTQMNTLISKLVQENFEQLNTSVQRLNQWQQDNKEMISSLTLQYKEMSDNFENTSTTLTNVKNDTTTLVSEGGKLHQLVDALNQVIVDDSHFIETTRELRQTAELSKSNMEAFTESTTSLNEWVRKQRDFVDGVQNLIGKLEELNQFRDYGEQFWKGTKKKMEEGVNILAQGTQTLNDQLTNIDRQFYNRLNATLAELDSCITAMVEQVGQRNTQRRA